LQYQLSLLVKHTGLAKKVRPQTRDHNLSNLVFIVNRFFSGANVSQGSVATYARCGGIFNNDFTANLLRNLLVIKVENRLIFDRIMAVSLWPHMKMPDMKLQNIRIENEVFCCYFLKHKLCQTPNDIFLGPL